MPRRLRRLVLTRPGSRTLRHKHAAWFADPVDPVGMGIPHYAEIIKTPMDFGTIKGKYKGGRYASAEAFAADAPVFPR